MDGEPERPLERSATTRGSRGWRHLLAVLALGCVTALLVSAFVVLSRDPRTIVVQVAPALAVPASRANVPPPLAAPRRLGPREYAQGVYAENRDGPVGGGLTVVEVVGTGEAAKLRLVVHVKATDPRLQMLRRHPGKEDVMVPTQVHRLDGNVHEVTMPTSQLRPEDRLFLLVDDGAGDATLLPVSVP